MQTEHLLATRLTRCLKADWAALWAEVRADVTKTVTKRRLPTQRMDSDGLADEAQVLTQRVLRTLAKKASPRLGSWPRMGFKSSA